MTAAAAPLRIVIAEDDESMQTLLAMLIEREPELECVGVAADGLAALSVAEREQPDVLLLDLAMPRLDGFGVLERLAATAPDVRVVVYSSYDDPMFQTAARSLGAADYLVKSDASPEALIAAIKPRPAGDEWANAGPA
jgi:DNA-binding NarL/FixJ family response regulator